MRTLSLNKRPIWHIEHIGEEKLFDEDGLFTGEIKKLYSEPKKAFLNLYNSTSDIVKEMFGNTNAIDIVCSDEKIELDMTSKLFYEEPTENTDLEREFDLEVSAIAYSLNHTNYGFRIVK